LLWKWLGRNGFTSQQVIQIADHLRKGTSSESTWFYSPLRRVCIQNNRIVCLALPQAISETILSIPWSGWGVHIDDCHPSEVEFASDQKRQYLDAGRVSLPLVLRNWKEGDRFQPLGLAGNQKVSDFLTHAKLPAWQKEGVVVLCSGDEVLAVLQQRISENFKKTDSTLRCLRIQFS
jgi:tRNA(Ile)-lysidine synthase